MNRFKIYNQDNYVNEIENRFKKQNITPQKSYNYTSYPEQEEYPEQQTTPYVANNNQKSLSDYISQIDQQQYYYLPDIITDKKEEDKGNFFQRARQTIRDFGTTIEKGVFQGAERFVDWGASLLGDIGAGVVTKFGKDEFLIGEDNKYQKAERIKQSTQDFIKRNLTQELLGSDLYNFYYDPVGKVNGQDYALQKIQQQSYISELGPEAQNYVRGIGEGIGEMLPAVALGGGGSSLYFFGSSFGGSMEEALEQGASYEDAKTYGFLSGLTETVIEQAFGIGENFVGKGLTKIGGKFAPALTAKLSTNKIVKIAASSLGEGIEELASGKINPKLKRVTFDPDAPETSNEELLQSFIIGAAIGGIMETASVSLDSSSIRTQAEEIDNLIDLQMEAYKNGRFGDAKLIAEMIQKKSDKLGSQIETEIDLTDTYASKKIETLNKISEKADQQKYATASKNLQDSISEDLKQMSKEDRQKFIQDNKVDYIFDEEGNIKESYTKLTDKQKSDIVKINKLTKIDTNLKIKYVTENKNIQGYYSRNNNQITINLNAEDPYRFVGIHEFTHSLEGSKSYNNLRDFIVKNLKKQNKYASEFKKSRSLYKSEFDSTSKAIDLKSKLQKGEITQKEYYDQYHNMLRNYVEEEMVAKTISEDIFTDENTINELVGENESLGKRILKWINNKIKGTEPEFNAWRKELKTAKKLYQKAIDEKIANKKETDRKDLLGLDEQTKKIILNKYDTIKFSLTNYENKYQTGEAKGTDIFDKTKTAAGSFYESLIPGNEENDYMRDVKNVVGKIEYMTPQEYYKRCVNDIFKRGTIESLKESRIKYPYKGYIDQLKEVVTVKKLQYPMPFLDYKYTTQEGLHRMMVAGDLFGWDKVEFPVLIIDVYDKQLQKEWDLKDDIYSVKRRYNYEKPKYNNYNELLEEINYAFEDYFENKNYNFEIENDILYITKDGTTVEENLEDYKIANREFEEEIKYSLKEDYNIELSEKEINQDLDLIEFDETEFMKSIYPEYFTMEWFEQREESLKKTYEKFGKEYNRDEAINATKQIIEELYRPIIKTKEEAIENQEQEKKSEIESIKEEEVKSGYFLNENINTSEEIKKLRESGKTLSFSEKRMKELIKKMPNAYITFISPQEFLELTLPNTVLNYLPFKEGLKQLDLEEFKKTENSIEHYGLGLMHLIVDNKTGVVYDHEGRHRMYALMKEGYTNVQIIIEFDRKDQTPSVLKPQYWTIGYSKRTIPFLKNTLTKLSNVDMSKFEKYNEDVESVRYSLKEKKPREPRVESTKKIPSDYVTGKAESKQPLKYGRKSTLEIYEGLIDSIALETDEVTIKGGKDKVIDYIFQQINTNKLTVDRIAEKIVDYVMKNTLISNEKIPTEFRNELLNNFKSDLQELAKTKGKDTFRTKMFERINSLKEKIQQSKEKEALKKTVKNLKQFKKLEGMDFSYNNNVRDIANLLDSGITAFSKLDPEFIDSYETRIAIRTFVELVERNNSIAIQREQFDRVFEIPEQLLKEAKDIFNHKKIQSQQDLNSSELRTFGRLISLIKHTVNDYLDSKAKLSALKANKRAKETIQQLDKAKNRPVTAISKVADKVIKLPILLKRLEGSSTGESFGLTKYVIEPMRNAQTKEMQNVMYLAQDFNNFNKNHKNFNQKLSKAFFTFDFVDENGNVIKQLEITLGQAITIYELSKRDAAARHFMPTLNAKAKGINVYDKKGNLKANLLLDGKHIENIYEKFDEETKEYIRITEKFFNEKARQLKIDTDNLYLGYTNVSDEFYFPISVDVEEMTLDFSRMSTSEYFENLFGQSFNQKVLDEANNALRLKAIDVLIADHISRLSKYNAYIVPATQIDRMMNTTVNGEMLHTVIDRKQPGMYKKMRDWFSDIVQTKKIDDSEKALSFFRSTYATSVLGFNAKSTITQLTAYPLAFKYISLKNLSKGAVSKMFSKEEFELMDEYCPYVKYRNFESSVVVQEANLKNLSSVQKVVMAPITFADRYTIGRIWRAVQFEIEETTGYKIGTEENLIRSGKMLEKIIRDSQAVDALEQPEIQRNKKGLNEFLLMFTKQSTQMLNSVVGSIYEYQSVQQRIKNVGETTELIKIRDKAKKQLQRSVAGTSMSIISATLISYLISNLFLGKDDEEKEDWKEILIELGSNTVGMFPYMNQIYSLFQGYDLNISLFTSIENLTSAFETIPSMLKRGEYTGVWHKFSSAIGPFIGVPFKNINELGVGIINLFNPDLAYKYRSVWYNKSVSEYTVDFDKALKNKDKKTAGNILLEIHKEKNIDLNEDLTNKLLPLFMSSEVENKASLFPKTANQTVTFDYQEYEMSDKQYRQFKKLYSKNLNKYIKSVTSNARYFQLSTAEKAQAIKYMQDYAYFTALSKILNINTIEATKVTLLGEAINPSLVSQVLAKCRGSLKGKKAEIQRYINSIPGITREQKYLLYGMLGYKPLKDNAYVQVSNYLATKGYTINEIQTILEKCKFIDDDEE